MFDPFVNRWASTQVCGPLSRCSQHVSSKVNLWKLMGSLMSRKMWRIFAKLLRFAICSLAGLIFPHAFLDAKVPAFLQNAPKYLIPRQFRNRTLCLEVVRLRASLFVFFFCFVAIVDFNQYWLVDWPSIEALCGNVRPIFVIQIQNRSSQISLNPTQSLQGQAGDSNGPLSRGETNGHTDAQRAEI